MWRTENVEKPYKSNIRNTIGIMKVCFGILVVLSVFGYSNAQSRKNLEEATPGKPFDNVLVKLLASDSLFSSYVIWVKKFVKLHQHVTHTEQVYVLDGTGVMMLGDSTFQVKSGDYIYMPKRTTHGVNTTSGIPLKVLPIQFPKFEGKDRHFVE